jgi:hypothetical protein
MHPDKHSHDGRRDDPAAAMGTDPVCGMKVPVKNVTLNMFPAQVRPSLERTA